MYARKLVSILATFGLLIAAGLATAAAQTPGTPAACACGEVTAFTAPAAGTPGSITIGGQTFAIADTTVITNASLIVVGSNLCLSAARDASGALVGPAAVAANDGSAQLSRPPVLNVPTSVTAATGTALTFDALGTDPVGGVTSVTACGLPDNATFDETTGRFSFTPAANQANRSFTVTFTGTTCFGGIVSRTVTINVGAESASGAPFFSAPAGPLQVNPGAASTFNVTAGSPTSGCAVTVTASGLPTGAAFDAASGNLTFTPTDDQLGRAFAVVFTATDCNDRTSTFTLPLFVTAADASTPGAICSPVKKVQFNKTPVGSICGSVTITVFNTGGQALDITSVGLTTGTDFLITGTSQSGSSLEGGGQMQVTITFVPTRRGKISDTLTIQSNDANQPSLTIKLIGQGQ